MDGEDDSVSQLLYAADAQLEIASADFWIKVLAPLYDYSARKYDTINIDNSRILKLIETEKGWKKWLPLFP